MAASPASHVCCSNCFNDPVLRRKIRAAGRRGTCPWCGSTARVVSLGVLSDDLKQLVREYARPAGFEGDSLDLVLEDRWQVFSDQLRSQGAGQPAALLAAILRFGFDPKEDVDNPDYSGLFLPREGSGADLLDRWEEQAAHLLGGSGGATPTTPDPSIDHVESVDLIADAIETRGPELQVQGRYFRARVHKDRTSSTLIRLAEMGAPPPEKATIGRANRQGEPVLYLAKTAQTALAEVRAWKGAVVAIVEMRLTRPLRILNLLRLPSLGSPFEYEHLSWELDARALLLALGRELSRPIIPGEEAVHYLPSQHACDKARAANFDGIAYPSSMGPAHNLVLFDVAAPVPTSIQYRQVLRPTFTTRAFPYAELRWDEP